MPRWSPLLALVLACASSSEAARPDAATSTAARGVSTPTAARTAACAPPNASLYDRLGQRAGIDAVMHTFVVNVGRDTRVNVRFLFTDMDVLQAHLTDQVCSASGGPCAYAGRAMKPLHAPMHVRGPEFDAMAEDMVAALKANGVPERESKELLAIVGSTRDDIVETEAK
ncbi:MAG: group I truncated hemoglobin [Myxococcaceae bacterium]